MELHERLASVQPTSMDGHDPFSEVKTRIHLAIISELGPQLYNSSGDLESMRARVVEAIKVRLADEPALSRPDRQRLEVQIASDILGYGPVEQLLLDETVSEVMINGPDDIWIEREGLLYRTDHRFADESHLRRIINKMVGQVGRRIDESS